ncbi:MAG: hypothetical protein ACRCX8_06735 [Sarcina sp.]
MKKINVGVNINPDICIWDESLEICDYCPQAHLLTNGGLKCGIFDEVLKVKVFKTFECGMEFRDKVYPRLKKCVESEVGI